MKLSEAAAKVIDLASQVQEYYLVESPKYHPDYPLIRSSDPTTPPPQQKKELQEFLESLEPDRIYQLITVVYLGRGDLNPVGLQDYYEQTKRTFKKPEYAISQMMEKAPLPEYLAEGLAELKQSRIDVDDPNSFDSP